VASCIVGASVYRAIDGDVASMLHVLLLSLCHSAGGNAGANGDMMDGYGVVMDEVKEW